MLDISAIIKKKYYQGTHRGSLPEETLGKIQKLCSSFGITRAANVTGLDTIGIPVIMVTRPNSRSLAVSQGKGTSVDAAKVSGLMESIESYHAERLHHSVRILSMSDMHSRYDLIDVTQLPKRRSQPLDDSSRISWVESYDLINNKKVWVPFELVHTDYTYPAPHDHGYFIATSNGLASGNSLLEAINHAICEVIERDALSIWEFRAPAYQDKHRVDLSTVDDEECLSILDKFNKADILVGVWDITNDIGIPTFLCKIMDNDINQAMAIRPAHGSGTHLSKNVALSRALTEAAQSRLTFISGARDDQYKSVYKQEQAESTIKDWQNEILNPKEVKDFRDLPTYHYDTFNQDFEHLISLLKSVGVEQVCCVDLTLDEFKIPVVRIIIPKLEGIGDTADRVFSLRAIKVLEESQSHE